MSVHPVSLLAAELDKPTATLVVSQDPQTRRFIGEFLLTAAACYLLKRFADKYLEGLGFDDLAKQHGAKTRQFLETLKSGSITQRAVDGLQCELDLAISSAQTRPKSEQARLAAKEEVFGVLMQVGAIQRQAQNESEKVNGVFDALLSR
jgi:hypothetical protein